MGTTIPCGRCGVDVEIASAELCWYCDGPLCAACWTSHGHCGHPEADAITADIARIKGVRPPKGDRHEES